MSKFRVYQYGLKAPTENAELVREQMFLAHRYHNTLIEIERGRRGAIRTLTRGHNATIRQLEADLLEADALVGKIVREIKTQHSETRSRLSTQTDKEELKVARQKKKEIKSQLIEARYLDKNNPSIINERTNINDLAKEAIKSARKHCGVYWGTSQLIDDAVEASRKMPLYNGEKDNDPSFKPWKHQGSVGVQIQKRDDIQGMDVKNVFGADTCFRIDCVNEGAFYAEKRGDRRKQRKTTMRMRINSDDKGKPIWSYFPMTMHRPLPDGGIIKKAKVRLKKIGSREEWSLSITVDMSNVLMTTNNNHEAVAIDIGWRDMKDDNGQTTGFRMCKSRGTDGKIEEIKLDPKIISAIKKANELRGLRDDNFNKERASFVAWAKVNVLPDWLVKETKTIAQWRSISRLVKLFKQWKNNRFDGDEVIFGVSGKWNKGDKSVITGTGLAGWAYHDFHLWNWEANQRTKAIRRRKEFYRVEASKLAKQYQTLVLEDFDLSDVSQTAEPEAEDDNQRGRSNKTISSPSEFKLALINAFDARNGKIEKVNPKGTSYICHLCKSKEHLDSTFHIHTCSKCHQTWDREDNATANILTLWRERLSDEQNAVSARKDENGNENKGVEETRYQRRNRAKQEKKARLETARNAEANIAE